MRALFTLSLNDFRSTFREPMFRILLFFPFIAFAIVRFMVPALVNAFPVMQPYMQVILMWGCLQSATMFGFIYGFLFLEEKEENIWQAIRVVPVSGLRLTFSRLLLGLMISTLVNYSLIHWGNIVHLPFFIEIILSFQFSLAAPLIALGLGALAKNRIEGLAQMKIINTILILPGLIYVLPYKTMHLTALIPTYWSFRSMELAGSYSLNFFVFLLVGFSFYMVCLLVLNRRMTQMME